MKRSTFRSISLVLATVLTVAAADPPAFHSAKVIIEIKGARPTDALAIVTAYLPKDGPAVEAQAVKNTGLIQLRVEAADVATAADRANELALAIRAKLRDEKSNQSVKIWEHAEPLSAALKAKFAKDPQ
jgi:hypothetical protein